VTDARRASVTTRDIGSRWEDAVLAYLQRAGLKTIARNFTFRYGEIDLIMHEQDQRDHDQIVFIEVRYRGDDLRGGGTVSVGAGKRAKLARAAAIYLQQNPALAAMTCRFDVVGCSGTPVTPVFEWTRSAFDAF
jgi:putative endonuclease